MLIHIHIKLESDHLLKHTHYPNKKSNDENQF